VVLTAATVGLGVASAVAVRNGSGSLAGAIETTLSQTQVAAILTTPAFEFLGLTLEFVADRRALYPTLSTETLQNWHRWRQDALEQALARGFIAPTGDPNNLGASEMVDILYLHAEELRKRDAYPVPGARAFEENLALYHNHPNTQGR
jgi:hypothetical protein